VVYGGCYSVFEVVSGKKNLKKKSFGSPKTWIVILRSLEPNGDLLPIKKKKQRSEQNSGTSIGFKAPKVLLQAKRMGLAHLLLAYFLFFSCF
jgi:hypothetical protein